ncbi:uncharacterized protein LOC131313885 isoform X1 [Rhododendron vialii]|uniref:uncharacterized protein LOC131313885 isoform X1 n=1 Tax=Rhododendron vialii TaxID=182163 RepID=UPI00265E8F4B|nr:uncharacterized protein LOC131313885 isoform X1 [Rhododendron vialii]
MNIAGEWAHNLEFSLSLSPTPNTALYLCLPNAVLVVAVFSPQTTTEIGAQSSLFKAEVALLLLNRFKVLTIESIRISHSSVLTRDGVLMEYRAGCWLLTMKILVVDVLGFFLVIRLFKYLSTRFG